TLGTTSATGTIVDDDGTPALDVSGLRQTEGNRGTTPLGCTATLSPASCQTGTVQFATGGRPATAGRSRSHARVEHLTAGGTLTFNPGETSKTIAITICGDTTSEGNETFVLTLSNPTNATLGTTSATGTIVDDDTGPGPGLPALGVTNSQLLEGNSGSNA